MRAPTVLLALAMLAVPLAGCVGGEKDAGTLGDDPAGDDVATTPVAAFTMTPQTGGKDTAFTFDASASKGTSLSYAWDLGGVARKSGARVTHTFGFTDATLLITLTVTDREGLTASFARPLRLGTGLNNPPVAAVTATPTWAKPGEAVSFDASPSTDPDGDTLTYSFGWRDLAVSATIDSGDIPANGRWSHTYSALGTHRLHCHPHPNMRHNVTVTPDATLGGRVEVVIQGFVYTPENLVVKPGTVVSYLNKDPVGHTVTTLTYEPVLNPIAAEGATGTVTFPNPGRYAVVVTAKDGKGGSASAEIPVLVDPARPDERWQKEWTGRMNATLVPGTALDETKRHSFRLDYAGKGTFDLVFTTPIPDSTMTLRLERSDGGAGGVEATGASPLSLPVDVPAGTWTLVVTTERGVAVDYTVTADLMLTLIPPEEDDGGGDGHEHAH